METSADQVCEPLSKTHGRCVRQALLGQLMLNAENPDQFAHILDAEFNGPDQLPAPCSPGCPRLSGPAF